MPKASEVTTFQCSECKMVFQGKRREFKAHLKQHELDKDINYDCNQCGKTFTKKFQLKDHILIHTQPLHCSECPRTFARGYQLQQHLKSHRHEIKYNLLFASKSDVFFFINF
jgi:KRAB domain-containing zinc finger protein